MGIFRRKNDEAFKIQLEREAIDKMNNNYDDYTLPTELGGDDSDWTMRGKTKAPHTITADEINKKVNLSNPEPQPINTKTEKIPMSPSEDETPSGFLYNKMVAARNQKLEEITAKPEPVKKSEPTVIKPEPTPPVKEEIKKPLDIDAAIKELKESINLKPTEDTAPKSAPVVDVKTTAPTEPVKITPPTPEQAKKAEERRTSLLARCNAYLEDEEFGTAKIDTEKYKLESVESILEGFENRAAQRVNKKFSTASAPTLPSEPTLTLDLKADLTKNKVNTLEETTKEENLNDTIVIPTTIEQPAQEENEVKHIFMAPDLAKETDPDEYTDISSTRVMPNIESSSVPTTDDSGATSIFKAVSQNVLGMHTELPNLPEEGYEPQADDVAFDDYETVADKDSVNTSLKHSKKRLNLRAFITLLLLVPAVLLLTPVAASLTVNGMMPLYIAELIICFAAIGVNFNIVRGVAGLFTGDADPDLPAALSIIGTTIFAVVNLIFDGKLFGFSSVALLTLLISNLAKAGFYSRAIKNFEIISNSEFKKAVSILKNKNATKAIVGNAIEGGALICCGAETTNVHSFLKYTYCNNPVADKIKKVTLIGLIFGVAFALASIFIIGSVPFAFGIFAAVLVITAAPATLLITNLPFKMVNNRLGLYDAMLTGYRAADEFDLCNGIAVNCSDLFPEGTIRLVDMKLLSPNPFDQSMLDAAAIAEAIGSPIAGIFKQVSATSSYELKKPEVDSVIYEEKMGISGWVNDRRVFVGNRILMEAHGFSGLPPVELDKKIMRKGYFPVYLASDNIPCALLVVKYTDDEDVGYELRRLCNTGTTVLVHNCDPNISDDMLCDYFGLPEDTIAVMSKQGSDAYAQIVSHKEHRSAGAVYKSNVAGLFAILTASINVKKSISAMSVIYIIGVILGILGLGISLFTAFVGAVAPLPILAFQVAATLITCLPPLLKKP